MIPIPRHLVAATAFAILVACAPFAHAQEGGAPVDADTFRAQGEQPAQSPTDAQLHQLLQQTLGNPSAKPIPEQPAKPQGPQAVWLVGMGQTICSDWMSPTIAGLAERGSEWISGYWTGMNTLNAANHNVGKEVGQASVIEDMKKRCTEHPSESLYVAASEVYVAYMHAGK